MRSQFDARIVSADADGVVALPNGTSGGVRLRARSKDTRSAAASHPLPKDTPAGTTVALDLVGEPL